MQAVMALLLDTIMFNYARNCYKKKIGSEFFTIIIKMMNLKSVQGKIFFFSFYLNSTIWVSYGELCLFMFIKLSDFDRTAHDILGE